MSRVILQPTSNKIALEHFKNTIATPVPMDTIEKYIDPKLSSDIRKIYPDGKVYIWGVTNGADGKNQEKWENISKGDVTLFSKKGGVFASAVTTLTFKNEKLARALWGEDAKHNTWENIYLVEEIQNINIPYSKLNQILGYKENYIIQGFRILSIEQGNKMLAAFDLFSDTYCEEVSKDEYKDVIEKLDLKENLDSTVLGNGRKEQAFLRNYLFKGKKTAVCGICGKEYPVDMLITAHIKKRSECTKEEKLDYKNVVMPMCKFGCDDLFEKGYIYVENAEIKINLKKQLTPDMKTELLKIEGNICKYFTTDSEKYFDAHREKFETLIGVDK